MRLSAFALILTLASPAIVRLDAQVVPPATFKLAFYNIKSGFGQVGLAATRRTFAATSNCTDKALPLNAWGVGVVQDELKRLANDPAVVSLGLAEAWTCATPAAVRAVLGWKSTSTERNGVAIVARYGFGGPEQWTQLDTSRNPNPSDTMWVLRVPVCLDRACSNTVEVFTAHWFAESLDDAVAAAIYEKQARQTLDFMGAVTAAQPHVLLGDLNVFGGTRPVCEQTPKNAPLKLLSDAGYVDAWMLTNPQDPGFTGMWNRVGCGVPVGGLWKRIDYSWSRHIRPTSMTRFGMVEPGHDAPSDHAGILVEYLHPTPEPPSPPSNVFGDFNGDGRADLSVFRPSSGQWFVTGVPSPQVGLTGDIPTPGDYNGDGITESAMYRPSAGLWLFAGTPNSIQFGRPGDIPVPADYDGDKKTDVAVFRTTDSNDGVWFVNNRLTRAWGLRGDIPMPADYDNDGTADLAVFRPSTGQWFVWFSATNTTTTVSFGLPGDIPVRADFDADGRTDFVVFRPSSGAWFLSQTTAGATAFVFGAAGDIPQAIDTDGDGRPEAAVWRPSTGEWFLFNRATNTSMVQQFGLPGDIPVLARPRLPSALSSDFDGDGRSEISVYRPSSGQWFTRFSSTGFTSTAAPQWGLSTDVRVPGDYDGDRRTDLAVFRPSTGEWFVLQSATATLRLVQWGLATDTPMPADYDGDGLTDMAVYRPSTGEWFVLTSSSGFLASSVTQWGLSSDTPLAADFDGDGRADFAVYRPAGGEWYLRLTTGAFGATLWRQWGLSSDVPIASDFDGDGRADIAVYRPSSGQWFVQDPILGAAHTVKQWGLSIDTPVGHDYDGDRVTDTAVYRRSTGEWYVRSSATGAFVIQWGLPSDVPNVPGREGSR